MDRGADGDPNAGGGEDILIGHAERHRQLALHALDSICPHEGGRIAPGPLAEGRFAFCPLHGYLFDPRTGAVVHGMCRKATTYRVEEKDGQATLYL